MAKQLTESYIVGFFSGIFAGLVVLAAQIFTPIDSFLNAVFLLLFIIIFFFIGLICVNFLAGRLK